MDTDAGLTISQVSKKIGVAASVIRFWEAEFGEYLVPGRTEGNQRRYSVDDLETLLMIKELLKNRKFKIQGAKEVLAELFRKKRETAQT